MDLDKPANLSIPAHVEKKKKSGICALDQGGWRRKARETFLWQKLLDALRFLDGGEQVNTAHRAAAGTHEAEYQDVNVGEEIKSQDS